MASLRTLLTRASGLATFGALAWVFCFADGCTDTRCDGSFTNYGRGENQGRSVSSTMWESGAQDDRWLDFSHEKLITFELQQQVGLRKIISVTPYISPTQTPAQNFGFFTLASGNLAVIQVLAPGYFTVRNDTCADYFMRVVVELEPEAPISSESDAGPPADASPADAALDAASDASEAADSAGDGP